MHPLIVISHSEVFTGEAAIIQQLFAEGLHCFHLRKPEAREEEVRELLDAVPAEYRPRIALHSFHHLADEYSVQRLHFTEQHRRMRVHYTVLKEKGYILSTSVHDLETLQTLSTCFSYTFLGPVFNSISKKNYMGIAGKNFYIPDDLKALPVIALGGISSENISEVPDMNFDGAAVLGALWQEPERALDKFRLLQKITLAEAQRR